MSDRLTAAWTTLGGSLCIDAEMAWVSGHARLVRAAIARTARRLMEGTVYVALSRLG
jgi:2-methylaconitate cis-trans-isomerase PrpF